jgi:hypothetical protein
MRSVSPAAVLDLTAVELLVFLVLGDKQPGALDLRHQADPLELILFARCGHRRKLPAGTDKKRSTHRGGPLCVAPTGFEPALPP